MIQNQTLILSILQYLMKMMGGAPPADPEMEAEVASIDGEVSREEYEAFIQSHSSGCDPGRKNKKKKM
ncbi:hypothetical protein JYU34_010361 [Plutella xylostella]|uniref:Uncharacterized protein n=1 Tax=Plutella xylostella TaxID=51655 RepID=A0ABQ7QI92_PLUXY|nr:hypothetical protein JYU34_010361 [Plutella xylostella]